MASVSVGWLALIAALTAGAPEPAPIPNESPWAVQEVVVHAPAPRLWKLTKGASTVYVLGTVEFTPRAMAWNKKPISRVMEKANRLIVPPIVSPSFFGFMQAAMQANQPPHHSLTAELPEDLSNRLRAVLVRLGERPDRLDRYKAGWAAMQLNFYFRGSKIATASEPMGALRKLAADRRVPTEEVGHYDMAPLLKDLASLPEDEGIELLRRQVEATETKLDHLSAIGEAWASGDLHALRLADRNSNLSLGAFRREATNSVQSLNARNDNDIVASVNAALARPGVSVTAFNIAAFASKGGAIERLRAEGVEITEPEE